MSSEGNTSARGVAGAILVLILILVPVGCSQGWISLPSGGSVPSTAGRGGAAEKWRIEIGDWNWSWSPDSKSDIEAAARGVKATVPEGMRQCDRRSARSNHGCALAKDFARKTVPAKQLKCLDTLWYNESGWDPYAENPSSGAYGITQALPAHKMAAAGKDWKTNPITQVVWGLGYINERYGTPCAALTFWLRTDARPHPGHWY